jgi:hypothetical protein
MEQCQVRLKKMCRDYDNHDPNLNGQMCFVIKEMFHMRL